MHLVPRKVGYFIESKRRHIFCNLKIVSCDGIDASELRLLE